MDRPAPYGPAITHENLKIHPGTSCWKSHCGDWSRTCPARSHEVFGLVSGTPPGGSPERARAQTRRLRHHRHGNQRLYALCSAHHTAPRHRFRDRQGFPDELRFDLHHGRFRCVERWKPGTIPMLLRPFCAEEIHLGGLPLLRGQFQRHVFGESLLQRHSIPAFVVEKVIEIVAARQPEHYDTSKPLPLPFGLRQVWTENQTVKGGRAGVA